MGDTIIRKATLADLPRIVAMLADDPLGAKRESPGLPLDPRYLAAFNAIAADPAQSLMAATIGSDVVGCLQLTIIPGISRMGAKRALVEGVRIAASHRGHGIGEQMMAWAKAEAIRAGCHVLQLTTDRTRVDAHRFYERLGFVASHVGMKLELDPARGD